MVLVLELVMLVSTVLVAMVLIARRALTGASLSA
jgi:hypothetical protein